MLATTRHGDWSGDARPLVIAHGLYGSGRNWGGIARTLSKDRPVLTLDMRNHGASPWADTHTYADMAADMAEVIAAHCGQADVLGHSMGGKAAMVLALDRPDLVARLIVADIAPAKYGHSQLHLIHAMRDLDLDGVTTRGDADRRLADAVPDAASRAFLLQSLDVAEARWRLNLDVLERDMPQIMGFPEIDAAFDGHVHFVSGGASEYVQPKHRPAIKALFPKARMISLPDAGHWLHAEKPREFAATVDAVLGRHGK